jgi:phosphatidylinositol alpha-1,6-mannosyltransferase
VTYVHGEEILVSQTSRQLAMLANRVYQDSDLVIANSENTRKILATTYSGIESVSIHPGVDVKRFSQVRDLREVYRTGCGWPPQTVVVLTLARMEPRKNHAMVIRAVAKLRADGVPVALICGGDGPERKALEALVSELHVAPWVKFMGSIAEEDKPTIFSSADIFAMPSISVGAMIEGFGIVFLEAAAAGLPTVCGNSGGQGEAVLNGKSGFAVDGESLEAVASAIKRLADSSDLRRTFGDAGRIWAAENDWEILGDKVQSAVQDVVRARALDKRTVQR